LFQDPTSDEELNAMSQDSLPSSNCSASQAEVAPWIIEGEIPNSPVNVPILIATKAEIIDPTLSLGYAIVASHDARFGKIVMYLNLVEEKKSVSAHQKCKLAVLDEPKYFTKLLTNFTKFVICSIGDAGCARGNATVDINDDHSITLTVHSKCFTDEQIIVNLSCAQLERIQIVHKWTMELHLRFLERVALLIQEASHDVLAEARIEAHGNCAACKSFAPHSRDHSCVAMSDKCLEELLKGALHPDEKWPHSTVMDKIYKRLAPHIGYFTKEFRKSMEINQFLCDTYKVEPVRNFVI
jgi:hypothetical protein